VHLLTYICREGVDRFRLHREMAVKLFSRKSNNKGRKMVLGVG